MSISTRADAGFSLIEVIVSAGLLVTTILAIAQLFSLAIGSTRSAERSTFAAALAAAKLEELRGLAWSFDVAGAPMSAPQVEAGDGVEYLDATGRVLDRAGPAGYIRRWAIDRLAADPANTLVMHVSVSDREHLDPRDTGRAHAPGEARLHMIRTRTAP